MEVAHLTFLPPFTAGSYNRSVGRIIRAFKESGHFAISYWKGPRPECPYDIDDYVVTVNESHIDPLHKISLHLPVMIRKNIYSGIESRQYTAYLLASIRVLSRYKPKLIICYDLWKLGSAIRKYADWPCRIILSQRGMSYFLPPEKSFNAYGIKSFDVVHHLTLASYKYDRERMHSYEPRVEIVPNGIDIGRFTPVSPEERLVIRSNLGLPRERNIVLFMGRLVPKKGVHIVISIWDKVIAQNGNAYLCIVGGGDDEYNEYIYKIIHALGVNDRVIMTGRISHDLTHLYFQAANAYIFPTLAVEGMPLSLMEAASCGLPCISSDQEAVREIFSDDEIIFVQNPNIAKTFVQPILSVLDDNEMCTRIGQAARKKIETKYSWEITLKYLEEYYRRELQLVEVHE